jgi:hypothetical protein
LEVAETPKSPFERFHVKDGKAIFGLEAVDEQVLNADGKWETKRHHRQRTVPMMDVWLVTQERQVLALSESKFVASLGQGISRVFKNKSGYGLEMALGQPVAEGCDVFFPTKALRKLLNLGRSVEDLSLDEFGHKHISNYADIKQVIKYVSFSSENKAILAGTPLNFPAILGAYYSQIRDIVSDADKLEAIGIVGIQRCIEYTTHTNPTYTRAQVMSDVKKHADEKLLRLASQFIKTPTARAIAIIRHNEMDEWLQAHTIPLPPTPSTARPYMFGDD